MESRLKFMDLRWRGASGEAPTAHVIRLSGREALNELFEFDVDVLIPAGQEVVVHDLLGTEATVTAEPFAGARRHVSGRISQLGRSESAHGYTRWTIRLVPQLWELTHRFGSRIFEEKTVPQILQTVLGGMNVDYGLAGKYRPRNYCVQYHESDFAFVSRLMEDEGIAYWFAHGPEGHGLIVSDQSGQAASSENRFRWDPIHGGTRNEPRIRRWTRSQEIGPATSTVYDHHFQMPGKTFKASALVSEPVTIGSMQHHLEGEFNRNLELADGLGGYAWHFDAVGANGKEQPEHLLHISESADHQAGIRLAADTCSRIDVRGAGDVVQMIPGLIFSLSGSVPNDGTYRLTHVEHEAAQAPPYSEAEPGLARYENRFHCLPATLPFRPQRQTSCPVIAGTQTATVVGPTDAMPHVDPLGRIKVRFPWERDAQSSCWLRVAQPWAGKRFGAFFWPRVGHEVVVAFEEGNPDRPIVVGSVHNADMPPPFDLPTGELFSGIKSASAGKDATPLADYNAVIFNDQPGKEQVQVHSQRANTSNNEQQLHEHVAQDSTSLVGGLPQSGSGGERRSAGWREHVAGSVGDILPALGKRFDFTIGDAVTSVLGLAGQNVVGNETNIYLNPLSYLSMAVPGTGASLASGITTGVGAALGRTRLTIGADTTLLYGPFLEVQRGGRPMIINEGFHVGYTALASAVGAISIAANIGVGLNRSHKVGWDIAANVIKGAALMFLTGLEATNALAKAAKKEADIAAFDAKSLNERSLLRDANEAQIRAKEALEDAKKAVEFMNPLNERKDGGNPFHLAAGDYYLHTGGAASFAANDRLAFMTRDSLTLSAQGSKDFVNFRGSTAVMHLYSPGEVLGYGARMRHMPEVLANHGEGAVTLSHGDTMRKGDYLELRRGPEGRILFRTDPAPGSPFVTLRDDHFGVSAGLPDNEAILAITMNSITLLKKTPAGNSDLVISKESCHAFVGTDNGISLSKDGIMLQGLSIEIDADTTILLEAQQRQSDAAINKATAPMTKHN